MKRLLLSSSAAILLLCSLANRAVGAPICASGRLKNSTIVAPKTEGESFTEEKCFIENNVLLNISGYSLPTRSVEVAVPNLVSFTYGNIGEGSAIIIDMPLDPFYAAPLNVVIDHVNFGLNSAIRFIGSLSPYSNISISNNVFQMEDRNPFMQDIAMVSAFSITFVQVEPLLFYQNATLAITSNYMDCRLVGESTQGFQQHAAVPISSLNGFTFYPNAQLLIEDNTFIAKCTPSEQFACAYGLMWSTVIYGENATCSVSRNTFNVDRGIGGFTPVINGGGMTAKFNDNKGNINSVSLNAVYNGAMKIRTGQMLAGSVFEVLNNNFETSGVASGFVFEPATSVTADSHVRIAYNSLTSTSGPASFFSFEDQVYADQSSSFWLHSNTLKSSEGYSSSPLRFKNPITSTKDSEICLFANTATSSPGQAKSTIDFVSQGGDGNQTAFVELDNSSVISLSNNSYEGTLLFGPIAMNATTTEPLASAATSIPCARAPALSAKGAIKYSITTKAPATTTRRPTTFAPGEPTVNGTRYPLDNQAVGGATVFGFLISFFLYLGALFVEEE
eukprot:GILI01001897.1.p1 GENE.GILI01001897.1~~GILI01001897.1.p1  ORF type:complete len:561 (-),score=135.47 GILI01001897.1:374-2056(-)